MYNSEARASALRLTALVLTLVVHASARAQDVSPPHLLQSVEPIYPADRLGSGEEPTITLHVTIEADGSVSDAHPEGDHDEAFDDAALSAVRSWRFAPRLLLSRRFWLRAAIMLSLA